MCAHIQNPDQVLDRERQCETEKQLLESEAHREHQCGLGETLFFLCLAFILKSIGISFLRSLISVFRVLALRCAETFSISAPWTGPPLSEPPGPGAKRELERPHLETKSGTAL